VKETRETYINCKKLTTIHIGYKIGYEELYTGARKFVKETSETYCRRFDSGGSLDRRVKLSLRVPAQMGWREMEHKGENTARVILRQGDALAVGVTSVRARERVSLFVSPFSRTTLPHGGPGPSFYRCKERVQVYNRGVAMR
jgi:hypothetical protein